MTLPYWPKDLPSTDTVASIDWDKDGEMVVKKVNVRLRCEDRQWLDIRGLRRGQDVSLSVADILREIANGLER